MNEQHFLALDPFDACHGSNRVFRKWFNRWRLVRGWSFALSVGVGLTPEMLPMIITASLAKVPLSWPRKRWSSKTQCYTDLGAIDILCTDKTGTLTQDVIVLEYPWISMAIWIWQS